VEREDYRPIERLSVGQKSTAILLLILLESKAPLIIDQPEDDLDNKFIYEDIVTKLRQEKERRQFVVATHNANIPVLGDAELILVMKAETQNGGLRGRVERSGSIDDPDLREAVELVLEGGKQAFELRRLKYGI
jgi:ABC-type cobalamin/Fe3+-siderophores transport system ATPase subunit